MDYETRFRLEYNKREIEERIRDYSAAALGYDTSILPYITDKSGKISDRRINAFIRELLSGGKWDVDGESIENAGVLSKEDQRFFGAFFYCSIRCYANDLMSRYAIYEPFETCTTFRHILDKAALAQRDIRFRSYESLLKNEYYNLITRKQNGENPEFYPLSGFFATMDHFYSYITGNGVESIDADGFRNIAASAPGPDSQPFDDESDQSMEKVAEKGTSSYDEFLEREKAEHEADEAVKAGSTATLAEYEEREERIRRTNAERIGEWEAFKNTFDSPDKFLAQYRLYRKLFFEAPKSDIYSRVESMCTDFLYHKGLLPYADDDDLAYEIVDLKRATSRLHHAIRRRRNDD